MMEIGDYLVINRSEQSSMASTWSEYLCLERKTWSNFELSIRGYELLAERTEYEDEDGEVNLPDEIDGNVVMGTEDEYGIGGSLVHHSDDYGTVEFTNPDENDVSEWLKSVDRSDDETKFKIVDIWKSILDVNHRSKQD